MKKNYLLFISLVWLLPCRAQLFQQTFGSRVAAFNNSSLVDANYISATPNNNQFTYIASGHSSASLSMPDATDDATNPNTFKTVTTSTSSIWAVCRNANFSTNPTAIKISFDLNVIPGSSGSNAKWFFYLGSGFANTVTTEANANIHSGFAMRYSSSSAFTLRTLSGTESSSFTGSTNRSVVFVVNNTGSSLSYTDPGGGTETVANDAWDLWVGTTKIFDEQAATTASQALNNFKFGDLASSSAGRANLYIDNFTITDLAPVAPVTFATFSAVQKQSGIAVNWKTSAEVNMDKFDIEKSTDGNGYNVIETIRAKGNISNGISSYDYLDVSPFAGNNFYRIKAIEKDGTVKYSSVMKVFIGKGKADFVVAPNPVKDKNANIQLVNLNKGVYTVDVFSLAGQKIKTTQFNHDGGSSSFNIPLPLTAQGIYKIVIRNNTVQLFKQLYVE